MGETERREEYLLRRRELIDGLNSQYDSFDKQMLLLSSGSFGVSFAFIKDVVPPPWHHPFFLILSWVLFAFCILIVLFSFIASQKAHDLEISHLDKNYRNSTDIERKNLWTQWTGFLNVSSMILFAFATLSLILFIACSPTIGGK